MGIVVASMETRPKYLQFAGSTFLKNLNMWLNTASDCWFLNIPAKILPDVASPGQVAIMSGFGSKFYPWKVSSEYGKVIPGPFQVWLCHYFCYNIYPHSFPNSRLHLKGGWWGKQITKIMTKSDLKWTWNDLSIPGGHFPGVELRPESTHDSHLTWGCYIWTDFCWYVQKSTIGSSS